MPSINLWAPSIEWIEFVPLGEGSGLDKNMTRTAAIGPESRWFVFVVQIVFKTHPPIYYTQIHQHLPLARFIQGSGRSTADPNPWCSMVLTFASQDTTSLRSKYRPASPPISGGPWDPFWGGSDEPLCDKLRSCMDRAAAATLDASLSAKGFWGSWIPRMSNWKLECWRSLRKFVWYWSTSHKHKFF